MSSKTPLYERHLTLGGRVVDFAGWMLPVQYEGVLAEHKHCRTSAVVFDTSHMGQFLIRGPEAEKQIMRVGTQDARAMAPGDCRYGFLLNPDAGVIDDTILMRLGADSFLLVVNAATAAGDFHWISEHLDGDAGITNRLSEGWGKIDLQGPLSARVLQPMLNINLTVMDYYTAARGECCGRSCIIARTGYTGELGYEIMAPAADLQLIFDELLGRAEVKPAGLGARDSLRLEMGYPLYGHEHSVDNNPIEAGMGGFIRPEGDFIGSRAIDSLTEAPGPNTLIAFRAESRRRTNPGDEILWDGRPVGLVTSGAFSPSLEVSIGLGYVRSELNEPGRQLLVRTARCELPVIVEKKPLYRNGTCRTKQPL